MKKIHTYLVLLVILIMQENSFAQGIIQGDWNTQAANYRGKNGQRFTFTFPPGVPTSRVWGTDLYTDDCSIASAAVHAGKINQNGGTVTIEIRAGAPGYKGSVRNGVTSADWGAFSGSFVFVSGQSNPTSVVSNAIPGDWNTEAVNYRGKNGQRFTFTFPPGVPTSRVWGTDLYTDDCSIASAAVHAGKINQNGGTVTIEIRAGAPGYKGSVRNGVTSADWGAFSGSFVFVSGQSNPTSVITNAIPAEWNTEAVNYRGKNGQRFTFTFPPGVPTSRVWGTDLYTDDCSIASAAVHAGMINQNGGTVTIEIRPGEKQYTGSLRNGVTSQSYGPFSGSFVFVSKSNIISADWNTQASAYRGKTGQRFTFSFPPGGVISTRLWGTDLYTDDSSIGAAAVHAGLITTQSGGIVTIEIRTGAPSYRGSTRNGVTSQNWGGFEGSFVFVR